MDDDIGNKVQQIDIGLFDFLQQRYFVLVMMWQYIDKSSVCGRIKHIDDDE